jgi:uncharacterized membrane protein (DUF4010 family)
MLELKAMKDVAPSRTHLISGLCTHVLGLYSVSGLFSCSCALLVRAATLLPAPRVCHMIMYEISYP